MGDSGGRWGTVGDSGEGWETVGKQERVNKCINPRARESEKRERSKVLEGTET